MAFIFSHSFLNAEHNGTLKILFITCISSTWLIDMDARIVKVKKGVNLVIGSYRFKKDRKYGEKQHWLCVGVVKGCKARMHTVDEGDDLTIVDQVNHNHIPDEEK